MSLLDKVLRAGEGRAVKELEKIAAQVNKFENEISGLDDQALRSKTDNFKERVANGESLDSILPEAFAVVREAAKRTLGQRHYDVQLMGGAALHKGNISEMRTGEGKTLVSTLPAYLNALTGKGVHIVTVNDYLAERDSEWMGRVHRFLGLKVGVILASMSPAERREAYAADITYGTQIVFLNGLTLLAGEDYYATGGFNGAIEVQFNSAPASTDRINIYGVDSTVGNWNGLNS